MKSKYKKYLKQNYHEGQRIVEEKERENKKQEEPICDRHVDGA